MQAARGAVVLCGGRSRRMGRPKEWLPFGPERLLQRAVRLAGAAVDHVVVVAAEGQDLPELPGSVRVARDEVADQGPLRGLATGLAALPDEVELAYLTATDAPFLRDGWVAALAALADGHDLVIPEADGRLHPAAALYRRGPALVAARARLAAGRFRLLDVRDVVAARVVPAAALAVVDPGRDTLRNLNTADDYRRALRDAGFDPGAGPPGGDG